MYRGFAHADPQYTAAMETARQDYRQAGGNDNPAAIANYQNAKSRAMQEAAKRYAAEIRTFAERQAN